VTITEENRGTQMEKKGQQPGANVAPRCTLYGLPCADCRLYYPANLKVCPVCSSVERVSPHTYARATSRALSTVARADSVTGSRWKSSCPSLGFDSRLPDLTGC
jgi:hypothetical protein